ncbi:DUF4250 family protein [Clostridium butyricum]|uniref:DUF4250 family protein n=1 Tax=Clostridium butyricum TaxID=1492 RepID=UPI003465CF37
MVNINNMDIKQFVIFINKELNKDKTISINKLADKLEIKKSTLKSKMSRHGYEYNHDLRQYQLIDRTTSNITSKNEDVEQVQGQQKEVTKVDTTSSITSLENVDVNKLNLLLNNIDMLLKLVEKKDTTSNITIDSKDTRVTSLRINQELYNMIKDRASSEKTSISDIVNRALIDYLKNYI